MCRKTWVFLKAWTRIPIEEPSAEAWCCESKAQWRSREEKLMETIRRGQERAKWKRLGVAICLVAFVSPLRTKQYTIGRRAETIKASRLIRAPTPTAVAPPDYVWKRKYHQNMHYDRVLVQYSDCIQNRTIAVRIQSWHNYCQNTVRNFLCRRNTVAIQSHCVRVWGLGYEISLFLRPYEILVTSTNYCSRNTVGSNQLWRRWNRNIQCRSHGMT
jgi:hypothetical protein